MQVQIIGAPLDLGAARRGTDMGPSAIRCARLHDALRGLGATVVDRGNVVVPGVESRTEDGNQRLRYLPEITTACGAVAREVEAAVHDGGFPLVLGGDHSVSIGTLAGLHRAGADFGVIWLDAHGDFNTAETTPSGNIHGMALAVATGRGCPELCALAGGAPAVADSAVVLMGVRALDPGERTALCASAVTVLTMKDVDEFGAAEVVRRAMAAASADGRRAVHLSCDLDVLDPVHAPGVGTPVPGGVTYREALLAMELLAESGLLRSMEVVEVNPVLDEANRTARTAVELVASALGERII